MRREAKLVSTLLCKQQWRYRDPVPLQPSAQWRGWSPKEKWPPSRLVFPWGPRRPPELPAAFEKSCCCGHPGSRTLQGLQCGHATKGRQEPDFSTCPASKGCNWKCKFHVPPMQPSPSASRSCPAVIGLQNTNCSLIILLKLRSWIPVLSCTVAAMGVGKISFRSLPRIFEITAKSCLTCS